jgi:hypothetical protein
MFYRFADDRRLRWLYLAAILSGLAWMVRFQLAFAVLPVPLVLWWETGRLRYALHYSLGVGAMLLASGLTDLYLLGKFASSTVTNLTMNTSLGALYNTIPLLYPALLLLLLVPPLSLWLPYLMGRPTFFKSHKLLMITSMTFLLFHMVHGNQQERFIFPILPAFLLVSILAIWHYASDRGGEKIRRPWFRWPAHISLVLNLGLLVFLTPAYGHKGMIEPLYWLNSNASCGRVVFVQPDIRRWVPIEYADPCFNRHRRYVRSWRDLEVLREIRGRIEPYDFCVVYPKREGDLPRYLDSLRSVIGVLKLRHTVEPSRYDQLLHLMNRKYNDNFAAFIYEVIPSDSARAPNAQKETARSR